MIMEELERGNYEISSLSALVLKGNSEPLFLLK